MGINDCVEGEAFVMISTRSSVHFDIYTFLIYIRIYLFSCSTYKKTWHRGIRGLWTPFLEITQYLRDSFRSSTGTLCRATSISSLTTHPSPLVKDRYPQIGSKTRLSFLIFPSSYFILGALSPRHAITRYSWTKLVPNECTLNCTIICTQPYTLSLRDFPLPWEILFSFFLSFNGSIFREIKFLKKSL